MHLRINKVSVSIRILKLCAINGDYFEPNTYTTKRGYTVQKLFHIAAAFGAIHYLIIIHAVPQHYTNRDECKQGS